MRPAPFPWEAAIAFGLGELRLAPAAFWALSMREFAALLAARAAPATPPRRADLAALLAAFPDRRPER